VSLKISLTKPQSQFFTSKHKFNAFVGGFGSGKSHALFTKLISEKLTHPEIDLGYFAPSYQLIRDIAHPRLQNMLDEAEIKYKLNKSDNVLDLLEYGRVLFRSMDMPDRIVGFEIGSAYIDEIDTMKFVDAQNAWNKIIARCRQTSHLHPDYVNRIDAATTPEGYNFVYDRWVRKAKTDSQYRLFKASTSSNPHLPKDYVQSLLDTYPANLVKAYIDGEFVNLNTSQVYPNFNRDANDTTRVLYPSEPIHIGMDFNVLNTNAIVHALDVEARQAYAVDEIIRVIDTPSMVRAIKEKYPDRQIFVYPDATGTSKKTVDASKSDLKLLHDAGFFVRAMTKNPPIKDRIQSMNGMFLTGSGDIHYRVNTKKCPNYAAALEQHSYDDNGMPRKDRTNSIDDINDAAGYCIYYNFPLTRRQFSERKVKNY
jgi:PBSX family phage terminase large subunit